MFGSNTENIALFETELGWMAAGGRQKSLLWMTFGHPSRQRALASVPAPTRQQASLSAWDPSLVERLVSYARGQRVDFDDVRVELWAMTEFQRRVIDLCRDIRYGETLSYGQLATLAGVPGAARAVGHCMASNRIPLVIPCHRVVGSGGGLGGYSAPGGLAIKQRLLEMEGALASC
jgi:methylated-DNA-[protein]-cysteine S-methyltransferase